MSEFEIIIEEEEEKLIEKIPNYRVESWNYKTLEQYIAEITRCISELDARKTALEAELAKMKKPKEAQL